MTGSAIGWEGLSPATVSELLPGALTAFDRVLAAVGTAADPELVELARRRIVTLLELPADVVPPLAVVTDAKAAALPQWPSSPELSDMERAGLGFAEQFVIDVAGITAADRDQLFHVLGNSGFGFVQALYVLDHGGRLATVLRQLFGGDVVTGRSGGPELALWPALEQMMTAVAALHSVDPLTAELIRLRGARAHHCRLCSSRRRASAVAADPGLLEATDPMDRAEITAAQRAAIALTDAILLQPAAVPPEVLAAVRRHFTPQQAGEIVLLVAHNAANKIAVALGADDPTVVEGVEYFEIAATGEYSYGLPAPG